MISPRAAIEAIVQNTPTLESIAFPLKKATGRVLSEDVVSPIHMPPFNQSAMDGYAISDLRAQKHRVVGEQKAGDSNDYRLSAGEAVRIFTGALVPETALAVVKQEDVEVKDSELRIDPKIVEKRMNIRYCGEQIKAGETAVHKGKVLNAGAIGFLATLGVTEVHITRLPKVSIVVTGSELVKAGKKLKPGEIYESNSLMLKTALKGLNIASKIHRVVDSREKTIEVLKKVAERSDVVIVTGGISVGDYDFVYEALQHLQVKDVFYKVAQKPGKPLYFGTLGDKAIFGLPGNPAAALTCFYLYIFPALRKMQGDEFVELLKLNVPLKEAFHKKGTLSNHLKGKIEGGSVTVLPKQSSAMLGDFTDANCIVMFPEEDKQWMKGDLVKVLLLPK